MSVSLFRPQAASDLRQMMIENTVLSCGMKLVSFSEASLQYFRTCSEKEAREVWRGLRKGELPIRAGDIANYDYYGQYTYQYAYLLLFKDEIQPILDKVKPRTGYKMGGNMVLLWNGKTCPKDHSYITKTNALRSEGE